jgi:hypothetical protein
MHEKNNMLTVLKLSERLKGVKALKMFAAGCASKPRNDFALHDGAAERQARANGLLGKERVR